MGHGDGRHGRWRVQVTLVVAVLCTTLALPGHVDRRWTGVESLRTAGIAGAKSPGSAAVALGPGARGAYLPGTSVFRHADGQLVTGLTPVAGISTPTFSKLSVREEVDAATSWLASGWVPGRTSAEHDMAVRALLDLRLLTGDSGATIAAPARSWRYVWPRDASWVAAAFAVTGHPQEARAVLTYLAQVQERNGTWAARYLPDGSGQTPDRRPAQLDAVGWVPWSVWLCARLAPDGGHALLTTMWPAVRSAANAALRSLGANGLPRPSRDWWEIGPTVTTIGTAAPLLAGLRAAADDAATLGHPVLAARYAAGARRLANAIDSSFGALGYPRSLSAGSGADAAVTFLAPPFAPYSDAVDEAVHRSERALTAPVGGVVPGQAFRQDPRVSWTAPTAFFALVAASTGDEDAAQQRLAWLAAHRTTVGALPEKVDGRGRPASVAPLGWTAAAVLLALASLDEPLPIPPVPAAR